MSRRPPWTLRAYGAAAAAFGLVAPVFLAWRRTRGREHAERSPERRGFPSQPRPKGSLVWLHGASVGEAVTILPLAERLIARGCRVLLTTGTVTSAAVAARRLPAGGIHQFVPLDVPAYVGRFLDHWRPDLAIFVESELWPVMLAESRRRRVPLVLANGRVSPRSFRRWQALPRTIAALLGTFDQCLAQSSLDADRFRTLAAPRVATPGNLKFDAPPPPADREALAALRQAVKGRPVWLAASTHPGEEAMAAAAHLALRRTHPDLLTIIAPRHPERGDALAGEIATLGPSVLQRSRGFLPDAGTQIYLADTMGELGLFYRLARIVFVGGSLARRGGQNPVEPAKLGAAILHGPNTWNFVDAYAELDARRAALPVTDADALAAAVGRLLADPAAALAMTEAAALAVRALGGALDRTMAALDPYLMQFALDGR